MDKFSLKRNNLAWLKYEMLELSNINKISIKNEYKKFLLLQFQLF